MVTITAAANGVKFTSIVAALLAGNNLLRLTKKIYISRQQKKT